MRYCIDTNIIIDILRGDASLRTKIEALPPEQVCITPIVLVELFKGAHLAKRQQEAIKLVEEFTNSIDLLEFSDAACKAFGQRYAELAQQGKLTQEPDLMTGCIALAHNATLVTRNVKDFRNIRGLNVVTW